MDIATLSGIIFGLILIIGAIVQGGSAQAFISIPSLMITLGGTASALLISYPFAKVKAVLSFTRKTFANDNLELSPWYDQILDLATEAKRSGLLALEDRLEQIDNPFLRRGMQMLADGGSPEAVRGVLEDEIEFMEERHGVGQSIFSTLGELAPAFGMIGTLIGLVQMLRNLDDPSQIGVGMATALLTTFYGALFANLFCIPMKNKLEQRSGEEVNLRRMLLAGILAIQAGENPRSIAHKLMTYIPPGERDNLNQ